MVNTTSLIIPHWPVPAHVSAVSTTRIGGVSQGLFSTLNLGLHIPDDPQSVLENRRLLAQWAALPQEPCWLEQVHGTEVAILNDKGMTYPSADAAYSNKVGKVCAVLTADCLPILLCAQQGMEVAAVHAGWRGLAQGVIENTLACFQADPTTILAWLGPAIGPQAFVVGEEVREQFLFHSMAAEQAFIRYKGKYLADLYTLARQRLHQLGVVHVYGGEHCTYSDPERFFSHRRDGITGRMASLIWLT